MQSLTLANRNFCTFLIFINSTQSVFFFCFWFGSVQFELLLSRFSAAFKCCLGSFLPGLFLLYFGFFTVFFIPINIRFVDYFKNHWNVALGPFLKLRRVYHLQLQLNQGMVSMDPKPWKCTLDDTE